MYTTSLVNTLVIRYKLTGEKHYYDRAEYFFNRGTKGEYGSFIRTTRDDEVHHFVDTSFSSGDGVFYLSWIQLRSATLTER